MATITTTSNPTEWKSILSAYSVTDVYFQYEYVKPMADHMKAEPLLIDYASENGGFLYCLLVMDIANDKKFAGLILNGTFFDAETPYGYGGPCFYGDMTFDSEEVRQCQGLIRDELRKRNIVTQFIRFYPFMYEEGKSSIITEKYGTYKNTIYMDLTDEETVLSNLDSQYRRKIRKAREAGVSIEHDKGEQIDEFIRLYNMTMSMHAAEDMYFFPKEYYDSLTRNFRDDIEVFYARLEGKIIGASIFLHDGEYMHFHLGGRDIDAPNVPFENLLMVEAALWGSKHGLKKLHLGGGLSDEDSLFQYKKKFNRSGMLPFYIGRLIIDDDKYMQLMEIRKNSDENFDSNNGFYIQYRF